MLTQLATPQRSSALRKLFRACKAAASRCKYHLTKEQGGQLNIDVFTNEILVLECMVAGTSFRQLGKVEASLSATGKLDKKRIQK